MSRIKKLEKEVDTLKRKLEEKEKELVDSSISKISKQDQMLGLVKDKPECPICMEIPRTVPVPVCPNGHLVCKTCKVEFCPTCRTAMGGGRSLLEATIIENIEHTYKQQSHEADCAHRAVCCPNPKCKERVPLSKLVDHLQTSEKCASSFQVGGLYTAIENYWHEMSFSSIEQADVISWLLTVYTFYGQFFGVFPKKSKGQFDFVIVMFASKSDCSRYKFEMKCLPLVAGVLDDEQTSVRYQGIPLSIDLEKKDLNVFVASGIFMDEVIKASSTMGHFKLAFKIWKQ